MSQLPPEFDEIQSSDYDAQYTADISMQMHIAEHIDISGTPADDARLLSHDTAVGGPENHMVAQHMTVPDKIIVLGQDRSVGIRNEPRLHLDLMSHDNVLETSSFVNLSTPPRVLTLDNRPFPSSHFDDDNARQHVSTVTHAHTAASLGPGGDGPLLNSINSSVVASRPVDMAAIERHLATLSEHVHRLEVENNQRWRRELVLYPLLFAYFLLRTARWIVASK